MLCVLVYDPFKSDKKVQDIRKSGLIKVYSGYVDWNEQFGTEIEDRIGRLLVSGEYSLSNNDERD